MSSVKDLTGIIFNIMRYSIYDGPGIRTTVFLKGCPASCLWCHNPEALSDKAQLMYRENRCRHCGDCTAACPQGAVFLQNGKTVTDRNSCRHCGTCVDVCYAEARELMGRSMTVEALMEEISRDIPFFEEPGIYFIPELIDRWKAENKSIDFIDYDRLEAYRDLGGIRIEENVVMTSNGYHILGKKRPRTIEEVESLRSPV